MQILDEIEEFFVQQPNWIRDAYAALRNGVTIDDSIIERLTQQCIENTTSATERNDPSVVSSVQPHSTQTVETPVNLVAIQNVQQIDRLAPNQTLKFELQGLTVVYGENGSGKTGYGRILRQVCSARGTVQTLQGNVFSGDQSPGSAEIVYLDGESKHSRIIGETREVESKHDPLRKFSIFDSWAAQSILTEENVTAFRPFGLDLLDRVADVMDKVKARLQQKLTENTASFIRVEDFAEKTKAGRLVRNLKDPSIRKSLDSILTGLTDSEKECQTKLRERINQAKANDPKKAAQALYATASRYDRLAKRVKSTCAAFSNEHLKELVGLRDETSKAKAAAEFARDSLLDNKKLAGIGTETWLRFWNAAREYGNIARGSSKSWINEGDLCVLCEQPLNSDAATRMQTLDNFVQGKLEAESNHLQEKLRSFEESLKKIPINEEDDPVLLQELDAHDSKIKEFFERTLLRVTQRAQRVRLSEPLIESDIDNFLLLEGMPLRAQFLLDGLREKADEFEKMANPAQFAALEDELLELDNREKLVDQAANIKKEVKRLDHCAALICAIQMTLTNKLSIKSKDLTRKHVSVALYERFQKEVADLGLHQLKVELRSTKAEKGKLLHKIVFVDNLQAQLRDTLSEGEFRCLALAAFLAEIGGTPSGVLFDDPVSSLDHVWRKKIVKRVTEEAEARQVIVFTHDIAFYWRLKQEAKLSGIKFTENCMIRHGDQAGYCSADPPWGGLAITERIKKLKADLESLKEQHNYNKRFEDDIRKWYGCFRETIERAIEERLFNGAIQRGSPKVETQRLRVVLLRIRPNEMDFNIINRLMTYCSEDMHGHDCPVDFHGVTPSLEDMQVDLQTLTNWVAHIQKRMETDQKSGSQLLLGSETVKISALNNASGCT